MSYLDELDHAAPELQRRLDTFAGVLQDIQPVASLQTLTALRAMPWARRAGVYVLIHGSSARYVGRALFGQGLATRLWEHIRVDTRFQMNASGDGDPQLAIYALADDDAWLAPSLELLLHQLLRDTQPLWNKKRC